MTRSLRRLKEQIVRANLLAQEASFIAEELNKRTEYLVTLQIPAANLDANRKVCVCVCVSKREIYYLFLYIYYRIFTLQSVSSCSGVFLDHTTLLGMTRPPLPLHMCSSNQRLNRGEMSHSVAKRGR